MRGELSRQSSMFSYVSPESRVPSNHPLRRIKKTGDEILRRLSPFFDTLYEDTGRESIPPEILLKSLLLQALYSIRSERLLCEMLEYNLLFRWFLDLPVDGRVFDHSTLSRNRERLLEHEVAREFFEEVVRYARELNLLSDERFTVDGSQVEAWASAKSFKAKDGDRDDDGSNFHGRQRLNETHESTTDPEARLFRKGPGKEAKLSYCVHILGDSKNNLLVEVETTPAGTKCEWEAGTRMIDRHYETFGVKPKIVAGDKNYHQRVFINELRERSIKPHLAVKDRVQHTGLDRRTTRHRSYRQSQHIRKFIEHPFGWMKTSGPMRKPKLRGVRRVSMAAELSGAFFNLLRISNLAPT